MDVRLRHPATFMVAGPTMVGKSYMVRDLIRKRQEIFTAPIDVVIWCYGCYQPLYDSFKDEGIHLHEGPISPTELQPNTSYLIIFDDLMQENNQGITDFFIRGAHHQNASVIYIVQNMFHQGKGHRTTSLNCHYMFIFKNPRDKAQVATLGRQMFPGNAKDLVKSYEDATKEPYGYLFVDLRPETPEALRLRGRLLEPTNDVYIPHGVRIPIMQTSDKL